MELELKLALPPAAHARLRAHPALVAATRGRARRQRLVATYFDTADARLAARGVALRVRREGRRWVQALKGPATADSGGGLAARAEHEWPLPGGSRAPSPDLARLAEVALGREVARHVGQRPLRPLFATEFDRTTIPLGFADGTTALAAIDVGRVRALPPGRRRAAIAELELELLAGDPARLFELALALAGDLGLRVELRSKAERGYALVVPPRRSPLRAQPVGYPRDATAADAFAAIARNCLRHIEGNAEGLAVDDDPEWTHQMRVGVRRLRSSLALARPWLAAGAVEPLVEELRWLAAALGSARDLDVFATQTLPAVRAAAARGPTPEALVAALDALAALAEAARGPARERARAAVASARFQRLLLATGATAAGMGRAMRAPEDAASAPAARTVAAKALRRRVRQLLRAGDGLAGQTPAQWHAFRIAVKKLRYAAEFFAPCFPGKRARAYRDALSGLQEILGRANDGAVAAALAASLAASQPQAAPAAALVAGWVAARLEHEAPALDRAWARLRRSRRGWPA